MRRYAYRTRPGRRIGCVVAAGGACCALFSLTPHTCAPCPLPAFSSRRCAGWEAPKDLAKTDAIKALLAVKGKWGW